jgi:hypothetical protein
MLRIDQFKNCQTGERLCGFFVRNADNKIVAIGAYSNGQPGSGFVQAARKRYERDFDLMEKVSRMVGMWPREKFASLGRGKGRG